MRSYQRRAAATLLGSALALAAQHGQGAGFHIDEQDARATGRAGAVIANPASAAAIYYNPAGIASLPGLYINLGASLVAPSAEFEPAGGGPTTAADAGAHVLPHVYASGRLTELVALGLGLNAPFGLALEWPRSSPGRAEAREVELRTLFVTPTIGLNLSRWAPGLTAGAGIALVPASVRLLRDVPFGEDVGSAALSGSAFGVGVRAGVIYRPKTRPDWSFGLVYKSPVSLDFDGHANFDAPPIYRSSLPPDGSASTAITLPQSLLLGVLFEPLPGWEIEVDGGWMGWSSYERLDIELPGGVVTRSERNWKDTVVLRAGTEYTFEERWTGRFGMIIDPTPVPNTTLDFQLPDMNRFDLTAGFGAALSRQVQVDIGALWVLPTSRKTASLAALAPPIKGTFSAEAWVVTISLGVHFGGADQTLLLEPFPAAPPAIEPAAVSPLFQPALGEPASTAPEVPPEPPEAVEARCRRFPGVRALQHQTRCPDDGSTESSPAPEPAPSPAPEP
jgi:long-chain fatty acid transport protein